MGTEHYEEGGEDRTRQGQLFGDLAPRTDDEGYPHPIQPDSPSLEDVPEEDVEDITRQDFTAEMVDRLVQALRGVDFRQEGMVVDMLEDEPWAFGRGGARKTMARRTRIVRRLMAQAVASGIPVWSLGKGIGLGGPDGGIENLRKSATKSRALGQGHIDRADALDRLAARLEQEAS